MINIQHFTLIDILRKVIYISIYEYKIKYDYLYLCIPTIHKGK